MRVYIDQDLVPAFSNLLKYCAKQRRAYHVVDADEVGRVSGSQHHEGICLLAKHQPATLRSVIEATARPQRVLALDEVGNPHNLGAILRTGAHYGASAAIIEGQADLPASAHRVAEGGASWVDPVGVRNLPFALGELRDAGFRVVGTSGRADRSLFETRFEDRVVIVLGSEGRGMRREVARACDDLVSIPGTGAVESLNVSAACAVVLSEIWRQDHLGRRGHRGRA